MFTGIVEGVGVVRKIQGSLRDRRIWIRSPFSLKKVRLGDSIAVDGCCLTVARLKAKEFGADLSPETLRRTTLGGLKKGAPVNLERPLRLGDRVGGHLVQGHVDGVGKIVAKKSVGSGEDAYFIMEIAVPSALQPYILEKGSIAVDGISLTVNEAKKGRISLCLIPHTQLRTALTVKKAGARVNLEVDMVLKYIQNLWKTGYLRSNTKVKPPRKIRGK